MATSSKQKQETQRDERDQSQEQNPKGENIKDKAQEAGKQATEKARQAGETVSEKAQEGARQAQKKADETTKAAGEKTQQTAEYMRENGPQEGMTGKAVQSMANQIDQVGDYLSQQGVSGMAEDFTNVIRKHPVPAMLAGMGVGFLIGQLISRR